MKSGVLSKSRWWVLSALCVLTAGIIVSCSIAANQDSMQNDANLTGFQSDAVAGSAPAPCGEYEYYPNVPCAYTYAQTFYFAKGTTVTFETRKSGTSADVDTVMHLFLTNNPASASWGSNDYGSGKYSYLKAVITAAGWYQLMVQSADYSGRGVCSLYKDGKLFSNVINVGGCTLKMNTAKTGKLTYFACDTAVDTVMWVMDSSDRVQAYNNDYTGLSDFKWGKLSRIDRDIPSKKYMVIASAGVVSTGSKATVYGGMINVWTNMPAAPGMRILTNDAIESAPTQGVDDIMYNCIAWAGGMTNGWIWPAESSSPWYVEGNDLQSFDNFFGNKPARYPGAWTYTRTGATSNNSVIDLYAAVFPTAFYYTHASVGLNGNSQPHGYNWESKDRKSVV
jgi:hypothetical protein